MKNEMPLVTVVTACFNTAKFTRFYAAGNRPEQC